MRFRSVQRVVWIVLALAFVAGCGRRAGGSGDGPAAGGGGGERAIRLAVLSPAMAVILRDLGRLDRVVGRHGWDMVCDPSVPIVGDQRGIDYEVLIRVNPDVIVMESGAEAVPARLLELSTQRGWRIERLPMLSLSDIRGAIVALDALTAGDEATPGERARGWLDRLDRATATQPGLAGHAGRVLILASADPVGVMGPGSFHYEIARSMGLDVLPADGAAYIAMPTEELHSLDPDTIVLIAPGATADSVEGLLSPLRGLGLHAMGPEGVARRVMVIDEALSLTPSTAMIAFAESLASRLRALPIVNR